MATSVNIESPQGHLPAWLATPAGDEPAPGVVVIHEAFGITDDTKAWTDRFGEAGYVAVAPDLLSRGFGPTCVMATFRALFRGKGAAVDDITAAREFLGARGDCTGKVGIIGFCMGGGFALVMAPKGFDASAPFYGQVPFKAEQALSGSCPVVGSYGKKDTSMMGAAKKLTKALDSLGVENDVKEYPDVGHSFMNKHDGWHAHFDKIPGMGYDAAASEDAWQRVTTFFSKHLAA